MRGAADQSKCSKIITVVVLVEVRMRTVAEQHDTTCTGTSLCNVRATTPTEIMTFLTRSPSAAVPLVRRNREKELI